MNDEVIILLNQINTSLNTILGIILFISILFILKEVAKIFLDIFGF